MSSILPRRAEEEAGAVSVEMALSLPVLVFFFLGVTAFTHAAYMRYVITGQAHAAARACRLGRFDEGKCTTEAKRLMPGSDKSCDDFAVVPHIGPFAGLEQTKLLRLKVECKYNLFAGFFKRIGVPLLDLSVTVVVPY